MSQSLVQFLETWQKSIAQVMTQIVAKPVTVSWQIAAAGAIPAVGDNDLWVRFSATSFGESAELAFHIRSADALTLSQIFMGEKIDSAATLSDDSREAVAEASRQIAGRAATELKQSFAGCELTYLEEPIPSWKPEASATFMLTSDGWSFNADVFLNAVLAQTLTKEKEEEAPERRSANEAASEEKLIPTAQSNPFPPSVPPSSVETVPPPAPPVRPQTSVHRVKRNNLELLLDVNLAVTLRFGQRQMTLRDILQLRSGSVIELDRQTDEPVDLLLDDRIIARGEVVVVDGNYGLRVSEICAQSERIGLLS